MLVQWPLCVQVDNRQTKTFQEGTCVKSKLRGVVDMREQWVRELKDLAKVRVKWVSDEQNKADLLTKCFPNWLFQRRLQLVAGATAAR